MVVTTCASRHHFDVEAGVEQFRGALRRVKDLDKVLKLALGVLPRRRQADRIVAVFRVGN